MNWIDEIAPRSGALECGDHVSAFESADAVSALQSGFAAKLLIDMDKT